MSSRNAPPRTVNVVRTPRKWTLKPEWMICGNGCGSISNRLWGGALRDDAKNGCEADYTKPRCSRSFQFSFEKVFLFSPLFLNKSESRVKVAYPEQSHSTIRNKIDPTVKQNFKIGSTIKARSRLMLCT